MYEWVSGVCTMCVAVYNPMHTHRPERRISGGMCCYSLPYSLETGSSTEPAARLAASYPQQSSCLHLPQHWSYRNRCTHSHALLLLWCWGSELRSSCLHEPPHSQALSPAQKWSLVLIFRSLKGTAVDVSFSLLIRTFVIIRRERGSFHRPPALDP